MTAIANSRGLEKYYIDQRIICYSYGHQLGPITQTVGNSAVNAKQLIAWIRQPVDKNDLGTVLFLPQLGIPGKDQKVRSPLHDCASPHNIAAMTTQIVRRKCRRS
eukprot:6203423-Pleurochrysis_carterae.AAC.4